MSLTPGKGASLSITIASTPTAIAELVSVTAPAMEMGTTETTNLGSTARTYIANILSGGEMALTVNYDSAQATHAALLSQFKAGTLAVFSILFTDTGATTIAFSGIMTGFKWSEAVIDNLVTVEISVQVSGDVTVTP